MATLTYHSLTKDQLKALARGINNTWNVIAADVQVRNLAEQIEVTLDADYRYYLKMYGGLSDDLLGLFDVLSFEEQAKVAYYAFTGKSI